MKNILLSIFFLLVAKAFAQTYTIEQYKSKYSGWMVSYAKIVPSNYDPTKRYPLLVAEHGNGEKTWNGSTPAKVEALLKNTTMVGYNILNSKKNYQMVVIVPVTPFSPSWPTMDGGKTTKFVAGAFLTEVIDTVTKRIKIDPSRIYITGLSEGGADMYDFMTLYANRVAACVPISCWPPMANATWEKTIADSKTPIWHFQSDNDGAGGSAANVGTYLSKISKMGADTRLTVYQLDGHNMWGFPYRNIQSPTYGGSNFNYASLSPQPVDFYDWMLSQSRGVKQDTINPFPIINDTAKGTGLKVVYSHPRNGPRVTNSNGIVSQCYYNYTSVLDTMWKKSTLPPVPGFPATDWKMIATGSIFFPYASAWEVKIGSDDGNILVIGGDTISSDWKDRAYKETSKAKQINAGRLPISFSFYNACCAWEFKLMWRQNAFSAWEVVPLKYLYTN